MVPLFKSVGYQLIYHTFSEKCEYIKFKFRHRPSTVFLAPAGIAKKLHPQDVQMSRLNNGNIILKSETMQSNI